MQTIDGTKVHILTDEMGDIADIMRKNRSITTDNERAFFTPTLSDLHDPFLMPDMGYAVTRILIAREKKERVVIFGDYDVDGVSSTALLVKFLTEIGCTVSYRLPHRSKDGYGLKSYFFDELSEKQVTLVITVDCGTRDIEPIRHAKSLGIDVIVTDHHAVPEVIPEEVVAILNPKRKDSLYPFPGLSGSGVAFKLVHGILVQMESQDCDATLMRYIDLASLGTVADCMPLIDENRVITTLGLRQMKNSESAGLRKFLESKETTDGDADIIGFQIGPRINASGRMDTPLTALRWLLASEDRCDEFLEEIEELNAKRQEVVKSFSEKALMEANPDEGILFYRDSELAHGLIGLVAGKLTEAYNRPSIVLCEQHAEKKVDEAKKREYENELPEKIAPLLQRGAGGNAYLVASCRSPDWCNLVELLDECKEYFVRYGGHRQAAGFTIEASRYEEFQKVIGKKFHEKYGDSISLPTKTLTVECEIQPKDVSLNTLSVLDTFKPFGIGNRKPLFLLRDVTLMDVKPLGKSGNHMSFTCAEIPGVRFISWRVEGKLLAELQRGNIICPIIELGRNEWNGKISLQCTVVSMLSCE